MDAGMIARLTAASVGLLAFAGMLVAGAAADNPFTTILLRALVGLFAGLGAGYLAGLIAQVLLRENLARIVAADAALAAPADPGLDGQDGEDVGFVEPEVNKATRESGRQSLQAPSAESPIQRAARQVLEEL